MFTQSKCFKIAVALLTALLILSYLFLIFLPHSHECAKADCSVCDIIDATDGMLIAISLSALFCQFTKISFIIFNACSYILSVRNATPVGLKVKLSD